MKDELHDVLSGKSEVRFGKTIQPICRYFADRTKTSGISKNEKYYKKEESKDLEFYISQNNLWLENIDFSQYVSEGAEQKVYLKDDSHVLKLNDSIYYNSWEDYFHNLLIHNYLFPDTAYDLLGFAKQNDTLYAVVKQAFVTITEHTDLIKVKEFLIANGFENTRNHDYFHPESGIILEDLHDENVLTKDGVLYFIDTVFYLTDKFWNLTQK